MYIIISMYELWARDRGLHTFFFKTSFLYRLYSPHRHPFYGQSFVLGHNPSLLGTKQPVISIGNIDLVCLD